MKKTRILLIGTFSFKKMDTGGQPVKSRELYWALLKKYGNNSVRFVEMLNWKKHPLFTLVKVVFCSLKNNIIVMLPAHNGLKVLSKILFYMKKFFRKKIFYDVIGGWLNDYLDKNNFLIKYLTFFDCVFVETTTMYTSLKQKSIQCAVIPNFKNLDPVSKSSLMSNRDKPLRLCIFSRITEKKGIGEAISAIGDINSKKKVFQLDIYGPIDDSYKELFFSLCNTHSQYVSYKNVVDPSKCVEVLKNYFAMIFPTKFYTEGIPGTIIDAYFSGLPVIASKWMNFGDVVKENITGFGFEFGNFNKLKDILVEISNKPEIISKMKSDCIEEANRYTPEFAISILDNYFFEKE